MHWGGGAESLLSDTVIFVYFALSQGYFWNTQNITFPVFRPFTKNMFRQKKNIPKILTLSVICPCTRICKNIFFGHTV